MAWDGINRRKFPRVVFECIIKVRTADSSLIFKTHTENASLGGIAVILEEGLPRYSRVELELYLPDDFPPVRCQGTIVWSIKRADSLKVKPSQYDTGIEFMELTDEDKARMEHIINELLEY